MSDKAKDEAVLVERAREMVPVLRERAMQAERDRRLPTETDSDFREAGFYRALQPARYGGLELDYGVQTTFARELARGCASSGWVGGILAAHGWMAGMLPDEAQAEIWGENPDVAIATSFLPVGVTVERKGEGLRLAGRWRFSSGVDYCAWAIALVSSKRWRLCRLRRHTRLPAPPVSRNATCESGSEQWSPGASLTTTAMQRHTACRQSMLRS